nr:hypothetical protein [Maliibacterium massiliense]
MKKGNYGIYLWFYAMLAFLLAFLGQVLLGGLLLGFVIAAEKDAWLTRQVMQAFFLSIFASCIKAVLGIFDVFSNVPVVNIITGGVFGFINSAVSIVVLVFVIIAMVRVCKGQEARIPGLHKLAQRAYGIVERKVYNTTQQPYQQPQAPQQPQNPQQPPQNPQQ